jgi:hypothetical protein
MPNRRPKKIRSLFNDNYWIAGRSESGPKAGSRSWCMRTARRSGVVRLF